MELVKKELILRKAPWLIFFFSVLILTFLVYSPGFSGGYLFDDESNLSPMGEHGGVASWENFRAFVFQGHSGPLGRPIALMSFLLDARTWPTDPYPFKLTNIWIHLLVGAALCWATLNLLRLYGEPEPRAWWGAVLCMAIWLLHPFMLSTTLYIVQRMTQLAALFMLIGLAGYLHGRLLMLNSVNFRCAYAWMSISLVLGTVFAVLSKENGALLPLLAWVVEACRPRSNHDSETNHHPVWFWRAIFFWAPTLAIMYFLAQQINFSEDAWPTRSFNQVERILTEPRIVFEYLYQLYIPRIEGRGLFQDGFPLSVGLFHPVGTFLSLVGMLALVAFSVWVRRMGRWGAYISVACLFFLVAHLLESTVVGLELYFEHRNYVASVFLFLPISMAILHLSDKRGVKVSVVLTSLLLLVLSSLTWQRASLWSNTEFLQNFWAASTPESARAQNRLSAQLFAAGRNEDAFNLLESAMHRMPESSLISMQWLLHKITLNQAAVDDFQSVGKRLSQQRFDAQTLAGIRLIVEVLLERPDNFENRKLTIELLDEMQKIPRFRNAYMFDRVEPYLRGLLLIANGKQNEAVPHLRLAMHRFNDVDFAISTVTNMANSGSYENALLLSKEASNILKNLPDSKLFLKRKDYEMKLLNINEALWREVDVKEELFNDKSH